MTESRRPSMMIYFFLLLIFVSGFWLGAIVTPSDHGELAACQSQLKRSMSETVVCEAVLDYCTTGPIDKECYKNIMEMKT